MSDQQAPSQDPTPSVVEPKNAKKTPSSNGWALGVAIIAIGAILLARNLGIDFFFLEFDNWWAIFILLAAIGPLQHAYSTFMREGFTNPVANSLVTTGAIVFVALLFLMDLSFMVWWPVFVIIGGLYMLTSRSNL